jgi:hypothetical protein
MKVGDLVVFRATSHHSASLHVEEGMIGLIIHEWGDEVVVRWNSCEDLEEKRNLEVISVGHKRGDIV